MVRQMVVHGRAIKSLVHWPKDRSRTRRCSAIEKTDGDVSTDFTSAEKIDIVVMNE